MGPPLEYESISSFASSIKFNAAESPLFSGLLISELQVGKKEKKIKTTVRQGGKLLLQKAKGTSIKKQGLLQTIIYNSAT
jgi:hypothetical protein